MDSKAYRASDLVETSTDSAREMIDALKSTRDFVDPEIDLIAAKIKLDTGKIDFGERNINSNTRMIDRKGRKIYSGTWRVKFERRKIDRECRRINLEMRLTKLHKGEFDLESGVSNRRRSHSNRPSLYRMLCELCCSLRLCAENSQLKWGILNAKTQRTAKLAKKKYTEHHCDLGALDVFEWLTRLANNR